MKKRFCTGDGNAHFVTFSCRGRRKLLAFPDACNIVVSVLASLAERKMVHVAGFVVMPNHVHAVLWLDNEKELPAVMQSWKGLSSRYLRNLFNNNCSEILDYLKNVKNGREMVSFWERRYYDFNIRSHKQFLEKLRYIHENPVRKSLACSADDYQWSSSAWYSCGQDVGIMIEPRI